jgi:hypothetical protein
MENTYGIFCSKLSWWSFFKGYEKNLLFFFSADGVEMGCGKERKEKYSESV